jgi:hypothetical protein
VAARKVTVEISIRAGNDECAKARVVAVRAPASMIPREAAT